LLQKSPQNLCRIEMRNNRIGVGGMLNQWCASPPILNQYCPPEGSKSFATKSARSRHVQRTARGSQGPKAEVISRSVGLAKWSLAITLPGFDHRVGLIQIPSARPSRPQRRI